MKAVIIEDETAAVSSLKAILRHNSVVDIEVVAELESIEDSIEWLSEFITTGYYFYGYSSGRRIGLQNL